jgi:hypothetical protein
MGWRCERETCAEARRSARSRADGWRRRSLSLCFASSDLNYRNWRARDAGCSWEYEDYIPHISVASAPSNPADLKTIEPYRGPIELGPEIFQEIEEDRASRSTEDGWYEYEPKQRMTFIVRNDLYILVEDRDNGVAVAADIKAVVARFVRSAWSMTIASHRPHATRSASSTGSSRTVALLSRCGYAQEALAS